MAVAITLMVALNVVVLLPVSDSFEAVEENLALRNAARVDEAIAARLESLTRTGWDWSHWDDSYNFVAGVAPQFVDLNLNAATLETIGVNMMVFYDRDARIVWEGIFDLETGEPFTVPQFAEGALKPGDPLLSSTERLSSIRGILRTDLGLMLVSAVPVVPGEDTGPANGTLILGRLIDDAMIETMRRRLSVEFSITEASTDAAGETMGGPGGGGEVTVVRDPDTLRALQTLSDIYGVPSVTIETRTPRDVSAVGERSIGISLLSVVVLGLIDIAVVWILVQRLVLRPLAGVTDRIHQIGETGDLDQRLPVEGRDECAAMGREFNRMLDRLAETRESLMQQTHRAEQARIDAEQANEAKTAFLTNMSHELRTPLNAVIGFSDLMLRDSLGPIGHPKYREYVSDISTSGRHLLELINSILELAQTTRGVLRLNEEEFPLAEALEAAVSLVRPMAERGCVTLSWPANADLGVVMADRTKVSQILINLLSNAIKFTPGSGQASVAVDRTLEDGIVIRIADTGIGIKAEDIPEALKPFARVPSDGDRTREGTGLGLPLTAELVRLHGGQLILESEVGVGTVVTVTLPPDRVIRLPGAVHSLAAGSAG